MEDLHGLLHRDYGLRPQGKSAPMGGTRAPPYNPNPNQNNHMSSSSMKDLFTDDHFGVLGAGSAAKATPASGFAMSSPAVGYDDIFKDLSAAGPKPSSTVPVYDAPVYDDDIFGGVHGVRSSSSAVSYDDVFSSARSVSPSFEDFLGGIGSNTTTTPAPASAPAATTATGSINGFDDLLPGFSSSQQPSPPAPSRSTESKPQQQQDSPKKPIDDPFVVLDAGSYSSNASSTTFHDPPEDFGNPAQPVYTNDMRQSSKKMSGIDDIFDSFQQTVPPASSTAKSSLSEKVSPGSSGASSPIQTAHKVESSQGNFTSNIEENNMETFSGRGVADFDISTGPDINSKTFATKDSFSYGDHPPYYEDHIPQNVTPQNKPDKYSDSVPDKWITIEEVVLYTNPTLAPPPRRPPPPLFVKQRGSSKRFEFEGDANFMRDLNNHELPKSHGSMFEGDRQPVVSSFDTLEEFAMGGIYAQSNGEQKESNSAATASAAAMREAMEKAEAKLRQAKEARDREKEEKEREARAYRAKEHEKKEREERMAQAARERQERERAARAAQEAHEHEEREREEQERERRRMEREHVDRATREARERAAAESRERAAAEAREKAQRAAVERATKEARERAVAEAREKAAAERERAEREAVERAAAEARQRAERAAVERAAAEARERAERAAVERAAAEARERAAAEARERAAAEKASVERAAAEVKMRSERAAVSRANAEARERAAAAAAKDRQRKSENDLESFFSNMSSRANSAPKQRPATPDSSFDDLFSNKGFTSEAPRKAPPVPPTGLKKNPAASSMTDDFNALFGNPKASGETFQEVEGETEERRRARLDRHQRTRERAEQALREKNERDLQAQREQAERHRIADTLDNEIKRWAAGKEGNLRTLLSTLQYILWPEAGWKPVSLNNLIDGRSLKKEYRKATLCVHPDKVQQKGATIQQKYIAEKVFDLLKEAWNKFESEEFF